MPQAGRGGLPGQAEKGGDNPHVDYRRVADDATRDRPLRRVDPALLADLHRGHVCQTFTYQFSQLAIRRPAVPPVTRSATLRPYVYRQRFGTPSPGLAAVKNAQAEDQRRQQIEAFRFNAKVRRRHRAEEQQHRRATANVKPKNLKSRDQLKIEARALAKETWLLNNPPRPQYLFMSFEEKVAMHYALGTLTEFLDSLRNG